MDITIEQEAKLLLNNEVRVTFARSEFHGQTGIVNGIMADGRTLDIKLANGKSVFFPRSSLELHATTSALMVWKYC